MAESTLSLSYEDLQIEVGFFVGYGTDSTVWTTAQLALVDRVIKAGLRAFYFNPQGHEWTFLKPLYSISTAAVTGTVTGQGTYNAGTGLTTVTVASGTLQTRMAGFNFTYGTSGTSYVISSVTSTSIVVLTGNASAETTGDTYAVDNMEDYNMPDDFGAVVGSLTMPSTGRNSVITLTSEYELRKMRTVEAEGVPRLAAIRQMAFTGATGQRWELMLYPRPTETLALTMKYSILPNMLTAALYPYGGAAHADTIKAACLASVESDVNHVVNGQWAMKFQERLVASIAVDGRNVADSLGYNGNVTSYQVDSGTLWHDYTTPLEFNGQP